MDLAEANLYKCLAKLNKEGYIVLFIALYGAQNYNLEREDSDYDYKAIVAPRLEDIVFNRKPVSLTLDCSELFNGQVDVKDIRLMVDQWKKGASNFLELLFSKWQWINSNYPEMNWFIENRELIAHANEESAIRAMVGMIAKKHRDLCHPYPIQIDEINKYGFAGKQLCHEFRLKNMIDYFYDLNYAMLLNPCYIEPHTDPEKIERIIDIQAERRADYRIFKDVKTQSAGLTLEEAKTFGSNLEAWAKEQFEKYKERNKFNFNSEILEKMDKVKFLIIKKVLKEEVLKDKEEFNVI
jgi:hypothetical protein